MNRSRLKIRRRIEKRIRSSLSLTRIFPIFEILVRSHLGKFLFFSPTKVENREGINSRELGTSVLARLGQIESRCRRTGEGVRERFIKARSKDFHHVNFPSARLRCTEIACFARHLLELLDDKISLRVLYVTAFSILPEISRDFFFYKLRDNFVSQERKGGIVINRPSLSKRQGKETLKEQSYYKLTNSFLTKL